jgi:hypothetical protein
MENIYTVHAYKWGDRENHSYSVGVYQKKHAALKTAEAEEEWRGGKYECEVLEWVPGSVNEDGSPGMPHKTIKALPDESRLRRLNKE